MEREGGGLQEKGRKKKIKGDDLYRLESIRLIRRRLNVKQTSSRVLLDLKIILQLMRRTIKLSFFTYINRRTLVHTHTRVRPRASSLLIGADNDTRLFVVYSLSPKRNHPGTSPVPADANSGRFLIVTAQNTHVKWTKKTTKPPPPQMFM